MGASPSTAKRNKKTTATVLDLPDFCLQKIFSHLDQADLVAVAEVCHRFRANAQSHSIKFKHVDFFVNGYAERLRLSSLRNFGVFIETINLYEAYGATERQRLVLNKLHRYCNETLSAITLNKFDATAIEDRVVFQRLRELNTVNCVLSERFLKNLPYSFPALRALHLNGVAVPTDLGGLYQHFEHLESICLHGLPHLQNSDVHAFLKFNPQLRKVQLTACEQITESILSTFAQCTPHLENLWLNRIRVNETYIEHFGRLNRLRSLRLGLMSGAVLLIDVIAARNIPIETLCLVTISDADSTEHLVNGISKCKTLKRLELSQNNWLKLTSSHICQISQQLTGLNELQLYRNGISLSTRDLLVLIQNMPELQLLRYNDPNSPRSGDFDFGTASAHAEIADIVSKRENKLPLRIIWNSRDYIVGNDESGCNRQPLNSISSSSS